MSESAGYIGNKKYNDLLKTARDLFWKHGFRRVTIEEICRKAGISKMTYYRFFPDKIELAKAVYNNVVQEGIQKFKDIMAEDIPPPEKIKKIILLKLEGTNDISQEFLKDFYHTDESGLPKYIEEISTQAWNEIMLDFKHAQEMGWFRKDFKPEFLLYFTQKMGMLYTDEYLVKLYPTTQDLVIEIINFFMYGISPRQ